MRVEIYFEVQPMKPHPSGGEMYDPDAPPTWRLQDSITCDDKEIVAGFLYGLADDVNPPSHGHNQRTTSAMMSNWKILILEKPRGDQTPDVIAELITKKPGVAGAMLRSTAKSICPDFGIKPPTMRD